MSNEFIDLTDKQIGEWHIIKYKGNGKWECICSCGTTKDVDGHELRRGATLSCGHNKRSEQNMIGKVFGEWTVIGKAEKPRYWTCRCSCGTVKDIHAYTLNKGTSKSCGHESGKLKDMTGMTFGKWKVLEYKGNGNWLCECECGTRSVLAGLSLRSGNSKSCGCSRSKYTIETKIKLHGDFKRGEAREQWQIDILNDKEKLENTIRLLRYNLGRNVSNQEIADLLGVTRTAIYTATKKYGITDYTLDKYHSIKIQQGQVEQFIRSIYNGDIMVDTRQIISPLEIDIYIPEKKLAIEFNGNYWHSSYAKDKLYHQDKTIRCAKKGIRLIHIFEYEWKNIDTREKLKTLIQNVLSNNQEIIYGRQTRVTEIDSKQAYQFEDKFHLQGRVNSAINLGCFRGDRLIGVMTFGQPRFNNNFEYEIIRLCWDSSVKVVGGIEKLFKHFLKNYNPTSIITYCDISKFTGNAYSKLGFKSVEITVPNYVWVGATDNKVLHRYETQKQKLIDMKLGKEEQTEDDIMKSIGYLKVYDSGNLRLEWRDNGQSQSEIV